MTLEKIMSKSTITVSHPGKTLFPDCEITKEDVSGYYRKIAPWMLPWVEARPLSFLVFPKGIDGEGFFSKHVPGHFPDFIDRVEVPTREPGQDPVKMATADEPEDLVYIAAQNAIEFHIALSRADNLESPDQIIFDLDPSDDDFDKVRRVAIRLRELLEDRKAASFVKLTGSTGVHVHVPIKPSGSFETTKAVARTLAESLHQDLPEMTTLEHRRNKRGKRVFIDYLRNEYAQTTIAPYSLRARPRAPVATPLRWDELEDSAIRPDRYSLSTIFKRLSRIKDPWDGFRDHPVSLDNLA
jgi:bifunctional non-homologous end joining protein LigD